MTKPKVLVLTSSYPKFKGDVNGNFVFELVTRLKCDFEIFVVAPGFNGSLKFEIIDGINIYRYKQFFLNNIELAYGSDILEKIKSNYLYLLVVPFFLFSQFQSIRKIVKKNNIKVIHAHWLIPQGLIAVLYKTFFNKRIKILTTIHGADINSIGNFIGKHFKRFIRFIFCNIDELTVVSNALKEKAIHLGYDKQIYVYPMGVDTKMFSPERKDQSVKIKNKISGLFLLFVGGLIERKGIRFLILAMPEVVKKFSDMILIVIGDGNLKDEMIKLAKTLNVDKNIHFLGAVPHDELPPYFATADLFILPSFSEGFGLVIIEAMSCKTLAITSNLEEIHDIIIENETGLFFKKITKDTISVKIISVLQNIEKYENIKEKGRDHVIEYFDWNIVSNNYFSLLSSLI